MGTKNFSNANDLITFSRASAGTALRKIAYGPELVTNGTFDTDTTGWTVNASGSLSLSSNRLRITNVSGRGGAYTSFATEVGKVYSISLDVPDSNNPPSAFWVFSGTAPNTSGNFSVFNQPAGSHEYSFVASSTTTYLTIYVSNSSVASYTEFDNISVKEVLFDQGTLTLFNHPAGIPRIEYGADGNVLGLLVEESRTNLLTYSEDFSNAAWNKANATLTAVEDGFIELEATNITCYIRDDSLSLVNGTASIDVSAGSSNYPYIILLPRNATDAANQGVAYFDLTDGSVVSASGTNASAGIARNPDGSYRISFYVDTSASASTNIEVRFGFASTAGSQLLSAGDTIKFRRAQFEAGAFPTSYIPTAGATATRSADVASIPVADFGYNQSEGTFVVDFDYVDPNNGDTNYLLSGGSLARFFYNNTGTSQWSVYSGSGISVSGISSDGSSNKAGIAMDDSGTTAYVDGGFVVYSGAVKPQGNVSYDHIAIGGVAVGTELNGHIKSIKYYPRRLSNAQLVELTS